MYETSLKMQGRRSATNRPSVSFAGVKTSAVEDVRVAGVWNIWEKGRWGGVWGREWKRLQKNPRTAPGVLGSLRKVFNFFGRTELFNGIIGPSPPFLVFLFQYSVTLSGPAGHQGKLYKNNKKLKKHIQYKYINIFISFRISRSAPLPSRKCLKCLWSGCLEMSRRFTRFVERPRCAPPGCVLAHAYRYRSVPHLPLSPVTIGQNVSASVEGVSRVDFVHTFPIRRVPMQPFPYPVMLIAATVMLVLRLSVRGDRLAKGTTPTTFPILVVTQNGSSNVPAGHSNSQFVFLKVIFLINILYFCA